MFSVVRPSNVPISKQTAGWRCRTNAAMSISSVGVTLPATSAMRDRFTAVSSRMISAAETFGTVGAGLARGSSISVSKPKCLQRA